MFFNTVFALGLFFLISTPNALATQALSQFDGNYSLNQFWGYSGDESSATSFKVRSRNNRLSILDNSLGFSYMIDLSDKTPVSFPEYTEYLKNKMEWARPYLRDVTLSNSRLSEDGKSLFVRLTYVVDINNPFGELSNARFFYDIKVSRETDGKVIGRGDLNDLDQELLKLTIVNLGLEDGFSLGLLDGMSNLVGFILDVVFKFVGTSTKILEPRIYKTVY